MSECTPCSLEREYGEWECREIRVGRGRGVEKVGEALRDLILTLSSEELGQVLVQLKMMILVCKYAPEGVLMEDGRMEA